MQEILEKQSIKLLRIYASVCFCFEQSYWQDIVIESERFNKVKNKKIGWVAAHQFLQDYLADSKSSHLALHVNYHLKIRGSKSFKQFSVTDSG